MRAAILITLITTLGSFAQALTPCEKSVAVLSGGVNGCGPNGRRARIEVRRCIGSGGLQLVALSSAPSARALVIDTGQDFVVQSLVRDKIAIVETGGGTTDRVFVIAYESGRPRLRLKQNTKASAHISTKPERIDLVIPGIWNGGDPSLDASFRTETYHLPLDAAQLGPVCN